MEYKDKKYTYLGGLMHGISTLATGMKTSIKVYFRKKVTEQYPENRKELKMFDRFRGTLNMPHNENNELLVLCRYGSCFGSICPLRQDGVK